MLVNTLARRGTTEACAREPYAAKKVGVCDAGCGPIRAPPELKSIRRGIVTEEIATAIFAPVRGRWLGVNVETKEFVSVHQNPDSDLPGLLEEKRQARDPKSVVIRAGPYKGYVQLARKRALPKEALDDVVCAANRAWRASDLREDRLADLARGHYLRDGPAWKEFGGNPENAGEATELLRLLEELDEGWR